MIRKLLRRVFSKETPLHEPALIPVEKHHIRRVPVVQEGRLLGIVSSRNAMDPELEEFVSEQRRREHHR